MSAILEKRVDHCEENIKDFSKQMQDVTNMLHQSETNIALIKSMQQTTTDELRRLRHDLKDLDASCVNNFFGVDKDIQKIKESVIFQEAHVKAKSKIMENWKTILIVIISVGSFLMAVIDWYAKR